MKRNHSTASTASPRVTSWGKRNLGTGAPRKAITTARRTGHRCPGYITIWELMAMVVIVVLAVWLELALMGNHAAAPQRPTPVATITVQTGSQP